MRGAWKAAVAGAALLALAGCGDGFMGAAGGPVLGPAPMILDRSDWSGAQSAAFNDMTVTARDERGWRLLWQLVGEAPPGPLPEGAMAVAVFLGQRPTAGYSVAITDVRSGSGRVVATYRETTPPAGDVTATVLTAPYAIRLAPLDSRPVDYQRVE